MKEYGGYLPLELPNGKGFFNKYENVIALNSGRASICLALKIEGADTIWLPYYNCEVVCEAVKRNGINIKFYHIGNSFMPLNINLKKMNGYF